MILLFSFCLCDLISMKRLKRWVAVNKQLWHWLTTHYVGYFMCVLFWYLYESKAAVICNVCSVVD